MRRHALRTATTAACFVFLALGLFTAPALASCAAPTGTLADRLAAANLVFVGTVTGVEGALPGSDAEGEGRIATVRVEEIWRGGDVAAVVEVRGGPAAANVATSVDRTFEVGRRYLFVPATARPPYRDNACTDTRPYSERLERFRPASPRLQSPSPSPEPTPADPGVPFDDEQPLSGTATGITLALIAVVAAGVVFVFRRGAG